VEVHLYDRHLLAFSVPGLGLLQPTRMPQGTRSSAFTINEMMHIAFGPILTSNEELSLLHADERDGLPPMLFYIGDIFVGHGDFHKQFAFMRYYLLPNLA
jgi:hypothetical protein